MTRDPAISLAPALDEDQRLVQQTFGAFLAAKVPISRVRAAGDGDGVDGELWREFLALGGAEVSVPESLGGGGGSLLDAVLIGIECGRTLAPFPYAEIASGAGLLARCSAGEVAMDVPRSVFERTDLAGRPPWVLGGTAATELVAVGLATLEIFDATAPEVAITPVRNLGRLPLVAVDTSRSVPTQVWPVSREAWQRWRSERRLFSAAVLFGAGERAFTLARAHLLERRQFGRPLGAFQALQHRLADHATALAAAQSLLVRAAGDIGRDAAAADGSAATALAWSIRSAEAAAQDALQLFGGYGYTLEYDVHLYLRFVKAYGVIVNDSDLFEDVLGERLREARPDSAPAGSARQRIAAFKHRHTTDEAIERVWGSGTVHDAPLHQALCREGLVGLTWPTALGGVAADPVETGQLWEAMNYHRLPVDLLELTEMVAHVILHAGSAQQQAALLPLIRTGRLLISLGYSEPDAGSDVAAVSTRAIRDGDEWRITGSKMFTTGAHVADLIFVLARTDGSALKHAGLSLFLVPRAAEGVSVFPVATFGGERTNAVFFDDVRVEASALLGPIGGGWAILNTALDYERQVMAAYSGQAQRLYDDLVQVLDGTQRLGEPIVRAHLGEFAAALAAARALTDDVGVRAARGREIDVSAAMAKLAATEVLKQLSYVALDLVGPAALVVPGPLEQWFRHAQIATIYGGSSEIQREIIARRGLDLPRG